MNKQIKFINNHYGVLGEFTDFEDYRVGDIVKVREINGSYESNLIVVKNYVDGEYSIMGFLSYTLKNINEDYKIEKIGSYKLLNEENIKLLSGFNNVSIESLELPKLTMKDLTKLVGYEFELVEED